MPLVSSITLLVTPQFGASLTDHSSVIIYDLNMFIIQATRLTSVAAV